MLNRIENARRLKEQCDKRARLLRAKGQHQAADNMERQAVQLGWELDELPKFAALQAFAARVED